jgi:hypothetical protein
MSVFDSDPQRRPLLQAVVREILILVVILIVIVPPFQALLEWQNQRKLAELADPAFRASLMEMIARRTAYHP